MSVARSKFVVFNPNVLKGLFNLKTMNFTENKLYEIQVDTLKDQTIKLDLSLNKIEIVNYSAVDGKLMLKTLLLLEVS